MQGKGDPWLSVLVPVYDVAPYLESMADSVLSQAGDGVELLLLDDASTDASGAIAAALAARWPARVRLLRHDANRGVAAARNTLLDAARGRWCWFVDGDDAVERGALQRLASIVAEPGAPPLVVCDYRIRRARESIKHRLRGERHRSAFVGGERIDGALELFEGVLASSNVFCWTVIAERRLWQDGPRFPEGHVFEDMATMPRLLLRAASARHVAEPWIVYRRRDDSVSGRMSADRVADLAQALVGVRDELLRRFPDAGMPPRFALAHQAARNLVAAVRHAERLDPAEAAALLPRCREAFRTAVGDDLALLWRHYRRRGWWARAWSLKQALTPAA